MRDAAGRGADLDWHSIARVAGKAGLYADDALFQTGLAEFEMLGGRFDTLHRLALLMVKPDGVAAGKGAETLRFLSEHGFVVIARSWTVFRRQTWEALWRYQLTSATADRLAVNELVLDGPALVLVLRHPAHAPPASVRLSRLKGPSDIARQESGCLRNRLGQPNRVLSFVHVADEPADVLREMPILLTGAERDRMWREALGGATLDPEDVAHELAELGPPRAVDLRLSLSRVNACVAASDYDRPARASALRRLEGVRSGERLDWNAFTRELADAGARCDRWDLCVIGSSYIVYDRPGGAKTIPPGGNELWPE